MMHMCVHVCMYMLCVYVLIYARMHMHAVLPGRSFAIN